MKKPRKLHVDRPDILKTFKRKPQPSQQFEGVDLNGHHPLESSEPMHDLLKSIRAFDNEVDDFMNLPRRE
jgi:hypothetical protein